MARKPPSKETMIKMIRGALKSPKTPKQLIPSLKKRLAKLTASAILLVSCLVHPASGSAQFIGYTSPQTVQQTLAPALTACTGAAQDFVTMNLGQTQHYASIAPSSNTRMSVGIIGQDATGNNFLISDVIFTGQASVATSSVTGSGYFPKVIVRVICTGGTFTLTYSGTSSTSNLNAGSFLTSTIDKLVFAGSPENANINGALAPPFGNTAGKVVFQYAAAAIAGSSISFLCQSAGGGTSFSITFGLVNTTNAQIFQVPSSPCTALTYSYTSGGAGAGTFFLDYLFTQPGQPSSEAPCPTAVAITVAAAGTQQIVAPVVGQKARVCGLYLSVTTGGTLTIVEGTGGTCLVNQSNVSGTMTLAVGSAPIISGGGPTLQTNIADNGLCLVSGTAVVAGWAQVERH